MYSNLIKCDLNTKYLCSLYIGTLFNSNLMFFNFNIEHDTFL